MAAFYNQATLSYSGGTLRSNVASGELLEVLSATKTAVAEEYTQGSEITYAINLVNTGTSAINGLTLTDDLGSYTLGTLTLVPTDYVAGSVRYFVNGALQAAPAVTAGPPLVITGINVPAGGNATVLYAVQTNGFAPPQAGGTIVNTVTVGGAGITEITATETVSAGETPVLDMVKTVSPAVVAENGQVTYTIEVYNNGNTAAQADDSVVISDTFDPVLTGITVEYNGSAWTAPTNYTYDEATGEFATVAGQITVPAASFVQDPATGEWTVNPGSATITISGTI